EARQGDTDALRKSHEAWWKAFWERSWIHVMTQPGAAATSESPAVQPAQGYALQRFINACAGRGAYPIKFNGSLFTVDAEDNGRKFDADYRRWGPCYWWQNTRFPYWSMLASGDFDMMPPLFKMYADAMPLAQARTRLYYGHDGAFFPETIYFWGAYQNEVYGWNREGK